MTVLSVLLKAQWISFTFFQSLVCDTRLANIDRTSLAYCARSLYMYPTTMLREEKRATVYGSIAT
jgi:hypothetical protein